MISQEKGAFSRFFGRVVASLDFSSGPSDPEQLKAYVLERKGDVSEWTARRFLDRMEEEGVSFRDCGLSAFGRMNLFQSVDRPFDASGANAPYLEKMIVDLEDPDVMTEAARGVV